MDAESSGELTWVKQPCEGGACIEVAALGDTVLIRSSAKTDCRPFVVTREEWVAFVAGAKNKVFDEILSSYFTPVAPGSGPATSRGPRGTATSPASPCTYPSPGSAPSRRSRQRRRSPLRTLSAESQCKLTAAPRPLATVSIRYGHDMSTSRRAAWPAG